MNPITFPLEPQMRGQKVADLQDALKFLLDRGAMKAMEPPNRPTAAELRALAEALRAERASKVFGDATRQLVFIFQIQNRLGDHRHGVVDEATANALNALLKELGALDKGDTAFVDSRYTVLCRAVDARGKPVAGLRIELFDQDPRTPPDLLGEPAVTDAEGMVVFRFRRSDFIEHPGEQGPDLFFKVFRDEVPLAYTPLDIPNDKGVLRNFQHQRGPIILRIDQHEAIRGTVVTVYGVPAERLALRLYRHDFGGQTTLLAETTTQTGGRYAFAYDPGAAEPVLEVRAVKPDGKEIALTRPLHGLTKDERASLNLVVPADAQPLEAEYRRLVKDLTPHVGEIRRLAGAKENGERQDITVLHRATGWDARLIALAAITERLVADEEVGLSAEGLYGLLRAGLPSDKLLLAQVEPVVVEEALKKVCGAGIVALSDAEIGTFKEQFAAFSNRVRLNLPAPGSVSTYGELLMASGLDARAQATFAEVFLRHRGGSANLWEEAKQAGLSDSQIGRLQLQGKLAFLSGNSARMTECLLKKELADPVALVEQDFHRAEAWKNEVFAAAGVSPERRANLTEADRTRLTAVIPAAYAAATVEARLELYAEDMARKIRLSYPTQTLTRLIETDDNFQPLAGQTSTLALLKNATAAGFRLGETPVAAFLKAKPEVKGNLSDAEFQTASQQVKTLQRLYQITPDNESMPVLMAMGITSAYDVTAYLQEQFVALYQATYIGTYKKPTPTNIPQLIYRKSRQVSTVTYNVFAVAKQIESSPNSPAFSPPPAVRESVKNELIKHYPTLESLFGSMDFCECEHCRSVLSPAAYFVDLLQFVDIEGQVWANFLAQWEATHGGRDYPHKDKNGNPMKPYDVLVERRPDLPHIALTCENTHTALPYIDIVNEILEYYVANGELAKGTAYDTGEATSSELLAEPQHVLAAAYEKLSGARYPLNLPFDRWLATSRAFCDHFETPLHRLLETFRPTDALFDVTTSYDRAAIFLESLGLSPAETKLFVEPNPLTKWFELYGFNSEAEATTEATDAETGQRVDLNSAKVLSRRLGVTYKDLTAIVQTGFVNPELQQLALLYKLGVSIADARFYQTHQAFHAQNKDLIGRARAKLSPADQARFDALAKRVPSTTLTGWEVLNEIGGFEQRLQTLADEFKTSPSNLRTAIANMPFDRALVLHDPDASCNFDRTILQYADGSKAKALDFLRINLFVRLWKKLGWSIEETDRALTTFIPATALGDAVQLPTWLQTALIYLAHLRALEEGVKVGKNARIKLLTLWADIPTTGKKPLYAQLFLTKNVLKTSPVFDHPLGQYLSDGSVKLKDHLLALQGALGLTADDIAAILADAGKTLDDTLSLSNVSLLYRYGLLAKGLKLSMRELIALKQMSGLDPFKPLHNRPLQDLNEDHPFSQTLAFVEAADAVKESGLTIEDLDYLLRHRFDPAGKYRPDRDVTLALLKMLAQGVRAIRTEHALPDDPSTLNDEVLQQKLGLVLPPDVVTQFMAMLNGTVEFTAVQSGVSQADSLPAEAFAAYPAIREVAYNATRQEQRLTFRGVLFDAQKNALKAAVDPALSGPQQTLFANLLDDVQKQARAFFDQHLRKQAGTPPESGFLENSDYDLLFAPVPDGLTEAQQQEHERQRRTRLAQAFFPFLQDRLIRQFIVQTLVAQTGADAVLVESLITDQRLLRIDGKSLLAAFAAIAERGVSAAFFDSANGSGMPQITSAVVASADTGLKDQHDPDGNPLNAANSARFGGYLEVTTPGAYRFFIELERQNAEAELRFVHLPEPVFLKGTAAGDNTTFGNEPNEFLELKAGVPYRFTLELKSLNGGQARLLVQGETLPKGPLSQIKLYPAAGWDVAERALLLLTKSLQIVQGLVLTERELRYILTNATDFGGVNLSELPTAPVDSATQRFARLRRLAAYARLRREMAGGTEDLISVFEANGTAAPDKLEKRVYPLIARITRRDEAMVKATAEALFSGPPVFASEQPLERLWEALQVVQRFGVPPASLKSWTGIVSATATAQQRFEIARDLRDTIKARFEDEAWQRVAQPIFDKLRQQSRDALVAHVMHQHGFARMEQLYEYFLIDPGMEPVVQTSRIRLAIASVQLFIQRCLLNLEPKVHPSLINSKQWEWMKRYRVWEANRKIFLFPENWLEPEFRDDKTHLFTELEGALLQGDVSSDLVEDAFLNYLKKLDELARLDIVAMHIEDNPDPGRRVLHVFGRTFSLPHKYFYRRYKNQMWTPWEPVSAQIEGDHLAPVIWRDRLYLFWVTFLEKPQRSIGDTTIDPTKTVTIAPPMRDIEAHLHWSEYVNGEWTTRESSQMNVPSPVVVRNVKSFDPAKVFVHVSKKYDDTDGAELGVLVHLGNWSQAADGRRQRDQSFYLAGRNSAPESGEYKEPPPNPFPSANTKAATRYRGNGAFKVRFREKITTEPGKTPPPVNRDILGQGSAYTLMPCDNELLSMGVSEEAYRNAAKSSAVKAAIESEPEDKIATLTRPVFYQDNRHTFFVEPSVTERTIKEWEDWVIKPAQTEPVTPAKLWFKELVVVPEITWKPPLPEPEDQQLSHITPEALINPVPVPDWLVNPATVLAFDNVLLGPTGQSGLEVMTTMDQPASVAHINVNPGSEVVGPVVVRAQHAFARSGLAVTDGGLNVIGRSGLNAALAQNIKQLNNLDSGAGLPGAGRFGR